MTGFTPIPLVTSQGTASAYIAAVAHEGECPAGFGIQSARLRGLDRPGRSAMTIRGQFGGNRRGYEPLRLVVTDEGAGGAAVLDVQLPDTLVSTPKCDPRDGWYGGSGYKYRNYSNALPPECTPGSAQGLRRVDFRWTGTNYVRVKVSKGSLPQVTGPLGVGLYRGTGPVNECDGYVGVANCEVGSGKAKCSVYY